MSRSGARSAPGVAAAAWSVASRAAEPQGAQLWLFPCAAGLRMALSQRTEATRQMCCARERLVVLERGGAGVEVHDLWAASDSARKPKCIKLGKKMKIHSVDQGAEHMLVLSSDGKPFEYNYSIEHARFQCILQEKSIIRITCGDYHSLALSKGGELFAWGQNSYGQLGVGRIFASTPTPEIVEHLSGVPLVQISAGEAHSMALSMSGNIYSWGRNDFGQLGLGHTKNKESPSLIEALDNQKVEFLTCGGFHAALLTKDGLVYTFGAGIYGQLGHNSTENELRPRLVTELVGNRVTQLACGRWHTLAYVSDLGKVFSFGSGKEGQLGSSGTQNQLIPLPMKLPSDEELKFESHASEKELIMIAGGNQSILLWLERENPYVNLRRKIPTLNEVTVNRWIADVGTKQWQNAKREIREIFSSPACLTGSFLKERIATEMIPVHLDLSKARNTFKELTQKEWITNTITTCLRDNLFKNLPFHSPHQEALEIFFLLPECPMMHDYNNWESLVVPFAEALCKMSDHSSGIMEKYWASLQESALSQLVQMFKRAITAQMRYWTESPESNCHIKALLEMLKRLHRINQAKCQLPENIFKINELMHWLDFYGEAYRRSSWKMSSGTSGDLHYPVIFSHFPFVFNNLSKIKLLYADSLLKIQCRSSRGVAACTYSQRWSSQGAAVCAHTAAKQPGNGCTHNSHLETPPGMQPPGPDPQATADAQLPDRQRKLGKGMKGTVLTGEHTRSLQTLLNDEGDGFGEVFYIYFNVHWDKSDVDLIPNGSCVIVNQTNKRDYVSKCVDYIFNISVKAVYDEFQRGFYRMCDKEIIGFFLPEELKDVMIGNTDYDWETFEKNAHYEQGYDSSHPTIVMFWKALHKLTMEEKKKFLVFLTGTDRIQVKGLKNMKITFCCPENFNEKDPIRAQTYFSVLFLPKYSTMERVEEALQVAINSTRGFG
nr:E3 ISG15--protein ligase HERC5 [Manis javanica]